MKKIIATIFACVLCVSLAMPAFASTYNYEFSSTYRQEGRTPQAAFAVGKSTEVADTKTTFGKPSSTDEPVSPDPMSQNVRRNKDAAALPPPYFYGSGDIPTDQSSLYHDNTPQYAGNGYNTGGNSDNYALGTQTTSSTSTTSSGISTSYAPQVLGYEASTSTVAVNTAPKYYNNGSIGTLYVDRTGKTITVYEGESLDNLKKGAGHFSSTSAWDGNVALCGHNRGSSAYFSFVKDMKTGDKVTYTTPYGERTYEVISKEQIGEYDHSKLGWSAENLLTLITCVENAAELRWAAVCREVR